MTSQRRKHAAKPRFSKAKRYQMPKKLTKIFLEKPPHKSTTTLHHGITPLYHTITIYSDTIEENVLAGTHERCDVTVTDILVTYLRKANTIL